MKGNLRGKGSVELEPRAPEEHSVLTTLVGLHDTTRRGLLEVTGKCILWLNDPHRNVIKKGRLLKCIKHTREGAVGSSHAPDNFKSSPSIDNTIHPSFKGARLTLLPWDDVSLRIGVGDDSLYISHLVCLVDLLGWEGLGSRSGEEALQVLTSLVLRSNSLLYDGLHTTCGRIKGLLGYGPSRGSNSSLSPRRSLYRSRLGTGSRGSSGCLLDGLYGPRSKGPRKSVGRFYRGGFRGDSLLSRLLNGLDSHCPADSLCSDLPINLLNLNSGLPGLGLLLETSLLFREESNVRLSVNPLSLKPSTFCFGALDRSRLSARCIKSKSRLGSLTLHQRHRATRSSHSIFRDIQEGRGFTSRAL